MPKNIYQSLPGCESPNNHFTIHPMYVPSILTTKQAPGVSPMSPTLQDASQRSDLRLRLPRLLSHGRGGLVAVADREWCGCALVICGDEDEDPWGWLGGIFLEFSSRIPGEMIQFDEHIFQIGWFNHQLDDHCDFSRLGVITHHPPWNTKIASLHTPENGRTWKRNLQDWRVNLRAKWDPNF